MKQGKMFFIVLILLILVSTGLILIYVNSKKISKEVNNANETKQKIITNPKPSPLDTLSQVNPASKNCINMGGNLEIITNKDESQFGICIFKEYSCEEWVLYKNECNIKKDAELVRQALISKGLNLKGMEVIIQKHLGKYLSGSVVPKDTMGGGGYFFAVKEDEKIKILADGNGTILCSAFKNYPEYPTYLLTECIDENGNSISR